MIKYKLHQQVYDSGFLEHVHNINPYMTTGSLPGVWDMRQSQYFTYT